MTTPNPVRADDELRTAVQEELDWTPEVDSTRIGVSVDDGTVALAGEVESYGERSAAVHAAFRVRGVRTVVGDLTVHPDGSWSVSEMDVAHEVAHALTTATNVPASVKAEVQGRRVSLTGEVKWDFERQAASRAVQHLRGVASVSNMIVLSPRVSAPDTEKRISAALARNAHLEAAAIDVSVSGTTVKLSGHVASWVEKDAAGKAAWSSPHVTSVDNRIVLRA